MENKSLQVSKSKKKKVIAIMSLICGLLGGYSMSTFSLIAVILGHIAIGKLKKDPYLFGGKGFAIAGLIIGYFGLVLMIVKTILEYRLKSTLNGL